MFRILLISLLILQAGFVFAQPAEELSLAQKEELLDKAQNALLWFKSLGDEYTQIRTAPEKYKEQVTPMELIQAAAILNDNKEEERSSLVEQLLLMLPFYRLTPEEQFEINDVLGTTALPNLADRGSAFLDKIPVDAQTFRTKMLNNAEKVILYQEPSTALELMQAVETLSVVGRPVLVRHYLRKFLNDAQYSASPEDSANIIESLGTQKLMLLAASPDFTPVGKEAAARLIGEAKKYWQDDAKIAEALKETNWFQEDDTDFQRITPAAKPALKALWRGGNISVQQGFQKLGEIENEKQADELVAVLLSLRTDMKEAFAAALASENSKLRSHAARGLAAAVSRQEMFLLYPFLYDDRVPEAEKEHVKRIINRGQGFVVVPNREQAAEVLFQRGKDYSEHRRPLRTNADGTVGYWTLNGGTIEYQMFESIDKAYKHFADQYIEQSYRIVPKDSKNADQYKADHIIAKIESQGVLLDNLFSVNNDESIVEAEQLLEKSLSNNRFTAAESLADWLGTNGTADLVKTATGKPRTLVQAVVAKDRRVRLAALSAILRLGVGEPFAGSSDVADTLVWFAKSDGNRLILSGHHQLAIANQTASMLLDEEYQTDSATSCRELFAKAATSPDVEMVFVDAQTPQPPVEEFLQIMRQDARTAEIPIAVLNSNGRAINPERNLQRRTAMMRFDRRDPDSSYRTSLSLNYPRVVNAQSALWIRDDLLLKTDANIVPPDERLEQAMAALEALYVIKQAEQKSGDKIYHFEDFDSVVLDALHSEKRIEYGLALAAVVKSAIIQSAIYEIAANVVYPMKQRELAGQAFEQSIESFGVLLRGNQVQRLYDRYNLSKTEPKESQELLSRLIDAVEEKALEK